MEDKVVGFRYGIMCDSLEKQANEQGYTLGKDAEHFDKLRECINRLKFSVATDSQCDSMFNKLHKMILKKLKPLS